MSMLAEKEFAETVARMQFCKDYLREVSGLTREQRLRNVLKQLAFEIKSPALTRGDIEAIVSFLGNLEVVCEYVRTQYGLDRGLILLSKISHINKEFLSKDSEKKGKSVCKRRLTKRL